MKILEYLEPKISKRQDTVSVRLHAIVMRRLAEKYNMDFEHRCCFRAQLNYKGLTHGNGEIVEVPMQSGKIGLYKVVSERYNIAFEDTGQRNWKFEFQGYKSA